MMSIQEKSKENSSSVIKKSEDKNLETQIQGSQSNLAKKSGPKETVKSLVKSSSESKINQPELGTCMSTRSAKAASSDKKASKSSSKNMVTVKGHSQQESTKKKKKLPQKNSVHGTSKSNEQLNRRSQRLQQLTEVSTRSLRNREIQGQVQAVKQTLPPRKEHCNNSQSKSNKVKTSQKHVKRKVPEIKSDSKEDEHLVTNEVINSPKGKKRKVEHQTAYTCSSQCIKGSEKYLQKNVKKEETKSVPVTSEIKSSKMITSAVSKKNEVKKSVHTQVNTSAKSQKSPQPSVPEQSVDNELEQAGRSKRGSILQLCEEIAGEIESDTVEVKKESSQMESVKEEKPTEIKLEETDNERQILHQKETNQDVHCNRFFPSRKTKPVKCILNGINSSTKKNSNWTKIKLSKFNSVQQNKLDSQVSPKLGLIRTSFSLPALEMHHPATQSTLLGTKPHNDKNIACQQEEMKEINSEEVKTNDVTVEVNKTTKSAPENCHLDNQIKPPPDPPLDNQMKESFESTPDKDFSLCLESKLESSPLGNISTVSALLGQAKIDTGENKFPGSAPKQHTILSNQASKTSDNRETPPNHSWPKCNSHLEITIPKVLKLKEAEKVDEKQLIIDAGQKRFGAVSCNVCGMLYTASNPEDETQHLLFHNQFISAVKYVVLLINHHECGSEEEFITSFFEVGKKKEFWLNILMAG
ncbi:N-acetyltransferase ESCO1 isoform X4 [Canis lupus familiaris]|uniref:N-acetyltransferase ESCO1 isoform X4 n=1 Tax=Canis lupus familiaris TaxID=9615 RepID=UPI0018F32312|nr:N-acetyltransferase ESCO1 isoform X4 [Canis lupus familiaris]XP_038432261.1 N-acetyltransferase ESCO1 isoform X4 [Canis lupus familiaris]XP_038528417.1 N-acetyltransferase ESCO1 isoform X4 [Canis lupus familiaris]